LGRRIALPLAIEVAAVFCILSLAIGQAGGTWRSLGWRGWLAVGGILLLTLGFGFVATVLLRGWRLATAHLPGSCFGMCLGKAEGRSTTPALTEWLYDQTQRIAFGDADRKTPLTFEDLKGRHVKLRVMTTDLTLARPVRLPSPGPDYWFARADLEALFPAEVLEYITREGVDTQPAKADVPVLHRFPSGYDLPVIVATRMSLSFPGLLSAVPLWTVQEDKAVRHWFSDGGISSNFPIHFFDAWVPSRPTFGLTLVPEPRVPDPLGRANIRGTFDFMQQIVDTMQNWRDSMQSKLPQFRDRVTEIRLGPGEGGMKHRHASRRHPEHRREGGRGRRKAH
jgi:hypothetical protein